MGILLYLISNVFLLLNINGIYWDDWVLYSQSFDEIKDLSNQLTGNTHLFEYIHLALSHIGNGVLSYRVATFIVYFLAGLFLYFILLDIKQIPQQSAFYIALLFLILPVNSARIALCDLPYGLFLCVFFFAFWLLTHYIHRNGTFLFRLAILGLFYLSFFVNSLLVFYAIVLLYIFYKTSCPAKRRHKLIIFAAHYLDFILLPIVFYYIKTTYFAPYGLYKNYNAVSSDHLNIFFKLFTSLKTAFYEPLLQSFIISGRFWGLFFITSLFLFLYLRKITTSDITPKQASGWVPAYAGMTMVLGFVFFALAIFPYVAVGKLPALSNFDSRHMLLVPLGLSLVLYCSILLVGRLNATLAHILLIALIASCLLKNMHDQTQYLKDWFYQIALEEHYKTNELIKNNATFIFKSDIPFVNNRSMQFYEHNGLLKKVFGDDKRFMGDNLGELQTYASYKQYKRYNFSSWNMTPPIEVRVHIAPDHDITQKLFFNLLFCMLENDVIFRREAKQLITMDVENV